MDVYLKAGTQVIPFVSKVAGKDRSQKTIGRKKEVNLRQDKTTGD